jgi:dihydrofolate reductase
MNPGSVVRSRGYEEAAITQERPMRKIFAFIMTTLDGYYEGLNQEFDFWVVDEEFNEFAAEQLDEVDTLVFGRVTFEGMAAYWPTPAAERDDPRVAARMNSLKKIVVSRTLDTAEWANTRLIKNDVSEELATLKQQPGKDIAILGSSDLTVSLLSMGLVDELRIMVNPVVLGSGKSVFRTADERITLRLLKSRPFSSGNVLVYYEPAARQTADKGS